MPSADEGGTARLRDLNEDECLALLAEHRVGRIAWNDLDEGPVVLPMNYTFDGQHVLIRTSTHAELARRFRPGRVAFEIDEYDPDTRTGWSVLVRGTARGVERDRLPSPLDGPTPVVGGDRNFHLRIAVHRVTGRRVLPA